MGAAAQHRGDALIRKQADAACAEIASRIPRPDYSNRPAPITKEAKRSTSRSAIRSWMRRSVDKYRDGRTGEVNLTALVEGWDRACDTGGATLDSDHIAWEVATEFTS